MQTQTGSVRCLVGAMALAVMFLVTPTYAANFTNPTSVNLLESWNPNLTYGLGISQTGGGDPLRATNYEDAGSGGYKDTNFQQNDSATYTFTTPQTIGKVMVNFRNTPESPTSYSLEDQNGVFMSGLVPGAGGFGQEFITFPARTSNFLKFNFIRPSGNNFMTIEQLGAYVASGQQVQADGRYNAFWNGFTIVNNSGGSATWTDHDLGLAKPSGAGGSITYDLGELWHLTHAGITQNNTSSILPNATVQLSKDGINFTTVWIDPTADNGYVFREAGNGAPYGIFNWNQPGFVGQSVIARYVRLSWTSGTPTEITEFQVFGVLPEPASLGLLGLGGMGLMGRRRRV